MNDLRDLFTKRENTFREMTTEIVHSIPNVIKGCEKFVIDQGSDVTNLEIVDVSYFQEHDLIAIVGVIKFATDEIPMLEDGTPINPNEYEDTDFYKAMLRLGIPYEMAVGASPDEIYKFLEETIDTNRDVVETMDGEIDPAGLTPSFDLNELTEEQREKLSLFNKTQIGTKS